MEKQDLKEQEKLNVKTSTIYTLATILFMILTGWVEIASTALTLNFFKGLGGEGIVRNGVIGFAIANDTVKVLGVTLAMVAFKRKDKANGRIFLIAGVLGLVVSFFASQAYDLNYAAQLRNEVTTMKSKATTESGDYKRQEELYKTTKNSLEASQKQLSTMTTVEQYINNDNEIRELKQQIKELGTLTNYQKSNNSDYGSKKYATRADNKNSALKNEYDNKKNNLTNKLASKENILRKEFLSTKKATENDIKKYNEQLEKIQNGFDKITTSTATGELETTSGMEQFSKQYGWSIKYIATGKNSYLEFLGVVLALLMAFCWKMSKKLKYEEENGIEYNGNDEDNGNNDGIINRIKKKINNRIGAVEEQQATSQNKLEMKKDSTLLNLSNNIKNGINKVMEKGWGTEIHPKDYKRKKVDLTKKENKIGFKFEPEVNKTIEIEKVEPEVKKEKETKTEKKLENKMSKLTKLDFLKFISALYNPATMYLKKYGTGYKKITDNTQLDKTKVKKIRDCLEMLEIIETETLQQGKREINVTKLKVSKAEALKKIFKIGGVL